MTTKKHHNILITLAANALIITLLFTSCGKDTSKETTKAEAELKTEQITFLLDSTYATSSAWWDSVMTQDDNKMADIKRLLDEISYTPAYDEQKLEELRKLFEEVKEMRYTQSTLSGDIIDNYDLMQDSLMKAVRYFAGVTPQLENYPLADELMRDIQEADQQVVLYRSEYGNHANIYNALLIKHEAVAAQTAHKDRTSFATFEVVQ